MSTSLTTHYPIYLHNDTCMPQQIGSEVERQSKANKSVVEESVPRIPSLMPRPHQRIYSPKAHLKPLCYGTVYSHSV